MYEYKYIYTIYIYIHLNIYIYGVVSYSQVYPFIQEIEYYFFLKVTVLTICPLFSPLILSCLWWCCNPLACGQQTSPIVLSRSLVPRAQPLETILQGIHQFIETLEKFVPQQKVNFSKEGPKKTKHILFKWLLWLCKLNEKIRCVFCVQFHYWTACVKCAVNVFSVVKFHEALWHVSWSAVGMYQYCYTSMAYVLIWVFPKIGGTPPKWMVKMMENPIKMWWFGGFSHVLIFT